jgi:hypothetical protein
MGVVMAVRGVPARRRVGCKLVLFGLLLSLLLANGPAMAEVLAPNNPIGVHSMLYLTHPFSAKQAMFQEAAAVGASTIRLDIELYGVFPDPNGPPDWSDVDPYMFLARLYHLRVLADLLAPPSYEVDCPAGTAPSLTDTCPPSDPSQWGRQAGMIAAHTRGAINDFEIVNEPDGRWAFLGTPQQYAAMLEASYDGIHGANPHAQVALGGLMNTGPAGQAWMNTMLATPGADARHKFDIANIHVRVPPAETGPVVCTWRRYFAANGFTGPLWVTETGYPADPSQQTDPGYQDGPASQARYLVTAIPNMIYAGAAKVFVTERDTLSGPYASEGFLQTPDPLPAFPTYTRRPSFYTIEHVARENWPPASRVRTARIRSAKRKSRPARSHKTSSCQYLDAGFYSRMREVNPNSSYSVNG